jgi:hypothetical protein
MWKEMFAMDRIQKRFEEGRNSVPYDNIIFSATNQLLVCSFSALRTYTAPPSPLPSESLET